MDRRTFLVKAGLVATWAGIPITISCSTEDTIGGPGGGSGDEVGTVGTADGHSHSGAVVTAAQLQAGSAVVLTLSFSSGHDHNANLSAQQVMDIGAGTTVSTISSTDNGHEHTVTFN